MILKRYIFVVLTLFSTSVCPLFSQETKQTFVDWLVIDHSLQQVIHPRHPMFAMVQSFPENAIDTAIDVITYDVEQDWYSALITPKALRPERKAEANVRITARSNVDDLATIVLDAVGLALDSVVSGGTKLPFTKNVRALTISLPTPLKRGNEIQFVIYYALLRDDLGANFIDTAEAKSVGVPGAFAYTMSQPENARRWYPCNDQPDDKALFSARVRVPKGFTFVSNGVITDSIRDGDSATIQTWRQAEPMSTYLFVMNAGEFIMYPQTYIRADKSTVPIRNYHFAPDQDGSLFNAVQALRNLPTMFEALEKRWGKYPFTTYGHVAVAGFPFGGMEHQSMSTVNRLWLRGADNGYAHELAHQWLGDLVTCATWSDIWLNEGGASFSEALYNEFIRGAEGYTQSLWRKRDRYMVNGLNEPPVYNIPLGNIFNEATTYCKSAWVYHMMRKLAGDSLYFATLQSYIEKYHNSSAQTFQLLEHFKSEIPNPSVPWDVFFTQWLVEAGHPIFDVVATKIAGRAKTTYRVTVSQTQMKEGVPQAFVTPLSMKLDGVDDLIDTTVFIDKRTQSFDVETGYDLVSLYVDLNNNILCEKQTNIVTDVDDGRSATSWFRLLGPSPINVHQPLRVFLEDGSNAEVTINDVSGRLVLVSAIDSGVSTIAISEFVPGAYVLSVRSGSRFGKSTFIITSR